MVEITKVTTKGQVVIPSEIRNELNLEEGSSLAVSSFNNFIIMKKVNISDPKEEFKKLTRWGEKFAKSKGIKRKEDVLKIIQKGRKR